MSILGAQKGPKSAKMYQKLTFLSIFGAPGHPKTRVLASVFRWENLCPFDLAAFSAKNRTKSLVKHEVSAFSKQVKPCILRVQTLFCFVFFSADSSKTRFSPGNLFLRTNHQASNHHASKPQRLKEGGPAAWGRSP